MWKNKRLKVNSVHILVCGFCFNQTSLLGAKMTLLFFLNSSAIKTHDDAFLKNDFLCASDDVRINDSSINKIQSRSRYFIKCVINDFLITTLLTSMNYL